MQTVFAQICTDLQVFQNRQVREYASAFGNQCDTHGNDLVGGFAHDLLTVIQDGSLFGFYQAGDGFQCGGFAGTVGADQCYDLAFGNDHINAFYSFDTAVGNHQIFDFKNITHRQPPPNMRR